MLCISRTFKDARRRVVETVLENVGASEKTVDEDYDAHVAKFNNMITDMNECEDKDDCFLCNYRSYSIFLFRWCRIA